MSTFRINVYNSEDNSYYSIINNGVAGENLLENDLCYLNTDGKFWKANSSLIDTSSTELRIAKEAITADEDGLFYVQGSVNSTIRPISLTVGVRYYLSDTDGEITTIKPNGSLVSRYIGSASSSNTLEFNPMDMSIDQVIGTSDDILNGWVKLREKNINIVFNSTQLSASYDSNQDVTYVGLADSFEVSGAIVAESFTGDGSGLTNLLLSESNSIQTITGAISFTSISADVNVVYSESTASLNLTIETTTNVALIKVINNGSNAIVFSAGTGVTITNFSTFLANGGVSDIIKIGTNEWIIN
jgi:hypothetical protein|tara:strand:- start:1295 stop:2197 length:903 start_codon:yes stop_codon:yes gene_type:complete